jgi:hypothetical protein
MKSVIVVVLCFLVAYANAFTSYSPPSSIGVVGVGKAIPRLSQQQQRTIAVAPQFRSKEETSTTTALANMLREYANYNDVWDGDYGYGGYGMGRGVYSRRGGGYG